MAEMAALGCHPWFRSVISVTYILGGIACVILAIVSLSLPRLYLCYKYNIEFKFEYIFSTNLSKLPESDKAVCRFLYLLIPALVLLVKIISAL